MKYRIIEVNNYGKIHYEIEYKNWIFWHPYDNGYLIVEYKTLEQAEVAIEFLKKGYSRKTIKEIE